jgi:hypothetical protein
MCYTCVYAKERLAPLHACVNAITQLTLHYTGVCVFTQERFLPLHTCVHGRKVLLFCDPTAAMSTAGKATLGLRILRRHLTAQRA